MKNYLLLSILCLAGILMSCTQKHTRYRIIITASVFRNAVMMSGGTK